MNWSESPAWATHKLTLEGGTSIWSTGAVPSVMLGAGENIQKLDVVAVEQRPEYRTHIPLKDDGKLVEYEVEGMITHNAAKRLLKDSGYDVRGLRFMLEYEQII